MLFYISTKKRFLKDSGNFSHEVAVALAESEYDKFRVVQDRILESDFDREVKKLLDSKKKKIIRKLRGTGLSLSSGLFQKRY